MVNSHVTAYPPVDRPISRQTIQAAQLSTARDAVWQKTDGSFDDFQMGIPRSWENVTPTSGIFKCRYAARRE